MAHGQFARLYFADIGTGSLPEILSVNVWGPSERVQAKLADIARPVIESLVIPDSLSR